MNEKLSNANSSADIYEKNSGKIEKAHFIEKFLRRKIVEKVKKFML